MNPLLAEALGSILRTALAIGAGWFVQHGIWTETQATSYTAAVVMAVLALGWSLWNKYRGRLRLLTALAMPPGTTENQIKAQVSDGQAPAASTPSNVAPRIRLALLLTCGLALPLVACGPTPPAQTPAAHAAATADQVLKRLIEFERVLVDASKAGQVTPAVERPLLEWAAITGNALAATPAGWKATVQASWPGIQLQIAKLPPPLSTYASILGALIGGL